MKRRSFLAAAAATAVSACQGGARSPRAGAAEVRLDPASNFNRAVAQAPAGARIILAPGTYRGWSVEPKDAQRFEAEGEGIVLDGEGQRLFAFHGRAQDVQLSGLSVQAYETMDPPDDRRQAQQFAALEVPWARNWQLVDVTVQRIGGRGVNLHQGMHILGGRFIDNGHIGMGGRAGEAIVERAEIARNNSRGYGSHWESGGYKNVGGGEGGLGFVMGGAKLIECHIHHNVGRAVWFDWDCLECGLERCVIHHNTNEGIAYEASARGFFRDCLIGFNNISEHATGVWAADLMLQNSHGCTVSGCTIVAERGCALSVAHHTRNPDSDPPQQQGRYTGPFDGMRNTITDNTFILLGDAIGLVLDVSAPPSWEEVEASNVWGPNRWIGRPGSGARSLWLGGRWSERLGTLEEHPKPETFVPPKLDA
jgi:hypothetical protein